MDRAFDVVCDTRITMHASCSVNSCACSSESVGIAWLPDRVSEPGRGSPYNNGGVVDAHVLFQLPCSLRLFVCSLCGNIFRSSTSFRGPRNGRGDRMRRRRGGARAPNVGCLDEPPESQARKWSNRALHRYASFVALEGTDDQVSEGKVVLTQKTWSR